MGVPGTLTREESMMRNVFVIVVAAVAIAGLTGCSTDDESRGDGGGGGGTINSSVPADTVAEDMTQEQLNESCQAFQDYVDSRISPAEFLEFECTIEGIFAAQLGQSDCETARDACIAEGPDEEDDECNPAEPITAPCTATVSEIEACIVARMALTEDLVDNLSCAAADDPSVMDSFEQENPAACEAIAETCPAIGSDDAE